MCRLCICVQKRSYRPTARTDDVIDNRVQTQAENARRADVMRNKINRPSSAAVSLPVYALCIGYAVRM